MYQTLTLFMFFLSLLLLSTTLEEKVSSVLPCPEEERWLAIPWRTNIMQARLDAQREGKPLFLWIMNGHPMGCT